MKTLYEKIYSDKVLGIQLTMRWGIFFFLMSEQKKKMRYFFIFFKRAENSVWERKLVLEENLDTCIPALDTSIGAKD